MTRKFPNLVILGGYTTFPRCGLTIPESFPAPLCFFCLDFTAHTSLTCAKEIKKQYTTL